MKGRDALPKTIEELEAEIASLTTDLTGARDRIKELNSESGGHRSAYNREKKAREDAEHARDEAATERDRLKSEHTIELDKQRIDLTAKSADAERRANETVAEYKGRRTNMDLETAATRLGMHDIEGLKLLDRSTLKVGDDGAVEGVDAAMEALKTAKPYLFNAAAKPGTVTGTTTTTVVTPKPGTPGPVDARTMPKADAQAAERAHLASLR